ncbi:20S proteasome subunit A/B [Alphaproteobacteria bacterium]|jgi:putative proteasome-type protease|nr:20S proteasome subunit A/B [Alphaproteobacteria bacterium]
MTYCVGIKVNEGMVFASDRRTNAGLDNYNSYTKMYVHNGIDRNIVILTSGNLATSQAVFNSISKDLEDPTNGNNLNNLYNLNEIAKYIGRLTVQHSSPDGINQVTLELGSTFIVGGHIQNQESDLYLVYPQGNFIKSSEFKPYLVIGEIKYGKPILDRVVKSDTYLGDAARCALISMDSTMKADLSVGPPIDLVVYKNNLSKIVYRQSLEINDEDYQYISKQWEKGIFEIFKSFDRFKWED